MSGGNGEKRALTDEEISEFLSNVTKKYRSDVDQVITSDSIAAMSFIGAQIVDSVASIVNLPSKFLVEEFKRSTLDKRLLHGLQNPYTQLALDLKKAYDLKLIPLFDSLVNFDRQNGSVLNLNESEIIKKFRQQSLYFKPALPVIRDPVIYNAFFAKEGINYSNLISTGKRFYEAISVEILSERFSDSEIEEYTIYTEDIRLVEQWNLLYKETIQEDKDDLREPYYNNFYSYIGSLVQAHQLSDLKNWLTILLEPLLMQLDISDIPSSNAIDTLKEKVPDAICKTIFTSTEENNKIYLVQFQFDSIVLGTGSARTLVDAEAKAASNALLRSSLIESVQKFNLQEINAQQPKPLFNDSATGVAHPVQNNGLPIPGPTQNGLPHHQPPPTATNPYQQQPSYDYPNSIARPMGQQIQQAQAQAQHQASQAQASSTSDETSYMDSDGLYKFIEPSDESKIDNSSKERLNSKLIQMKLPTAEYKTAKVSNSEVQVTCYIDNVPLAKTSSTNKKKAGQWVAQNVYDFFDYFVLNNPKIHGTS